jgi:PAS domain S-box-containing protein
MKTIEQFRHCATILDSINEGVITVDSNMIITAMNRAAAKITGYSREEAVGRRCAEIFCSTVCSLTCPVRDVMDTGEAASDIEAEILTKDNATVPVSFNAAVLYNELGKTVGAVKTFRDLSLLVAAQPTRGLDVGGHGRTHALLAALDEETQHEEIAGGRRELEALVQQPVTSFAYPYGYAGSFDARTQAVVRKAGYARACTTIADQVTRRTDPYRIPRYQVEDWCGDEFMARVELWLAA